MRRLCSSLPADNQLLIFNVWVHESQLDEVVLFFVFIVVCWSFVSWSVVFSSGQAVMTHQQQSLKAKSTELGEGMIHRHLQRERRESHFPGFHGNIPAPDSSIIPQHWDVPLSYLVGMMRTVDQETQRENWKKNGITAILQENYKRNDNIFLIQFSEDL